MYGGAGISRSAEFRGAHLRRRRVTSALGVVLSSLCAGIAAAVLLVILAHVVSQGAGALNGAFLTHVPRPVGFPGGGMANGIVGSALIIAIATLVAMPIGTLCGIYLGLVGRGPFAEVARFLVDVLAGVPSIAIGLFAYTVLVAPIRHFSGFSASFAFAILMLPLIIRITEESMLRVPALIREGALALGLSFYASTMHVVLPVARPSIITGLLLAIARVAGETAPLLFTAFGSQFWELNPANPMAVLSLQIFNYAISPYQDWHAQAWAGSIVLIFIVLILNVVARFALRPRFVKR